MFSLFLYIMLRLLIDLGDRIESRNAFMCMREREREREEGRGIEK